jgi:hypothetical protein
MAPESFAIEHPAAIKVARTQTPDWPNRMIVIGRKPENAVAGFGDPYARTGGPHECARLLLIIAIDRAEAN